MYLRTRKIIAMSCPLADSGSDGSDDDSVPEVP